jgi:NAD(P)-dependent dehydrogenase (short-subunit alcohol dehydrogenase family)
LLLNNQVVLVTGAGRGIGKAIAILFAREGASVIVNDINGHDVKDTADEIMHISGDAYSVVADVSQRNQVREMFDKVISIYKHINILVNSAGIQTETPFLELTDQEWDSVLACNLKGTFLCSQEAARAMIRQSGGKIINISSIHESVPRRNIAHYAASKAGVMMLTKVMAIELAPYNISAVCIAPGVTNTTMNADIIENPHKLSKVCNSIPLSRVADPDEVAQVALFLSSKNASYITGCTYYVDGGLSLGSML